MFLIFSAAERFRSAAQCFTHHALTGLDPTLYNKDGYGSATVMNIYVFIYLSQLGLIGGETEPKQ